MKLLAIQTDKGIFIKEDRESNSYNTSLFVIDTYLYDSCPIEKTFHPNWFKIKYFPNIISEKYFKAENKRYELIKTELASTIFPFILTEEEAKKFSASVLESLYIYKYDSKIMWKKFNLTIKEENFLTYILEEDSSQKIELEIIYSFKGNFEEPGKIEYSSYKENKISLVTNKNIKHQELDHILFPEFLLPLTPSKISSEDLYKIVRQFIITNHDPKVSIITSDYDFCFTIEKIVPLWTPEEISYQNIFARTKKERTKIHYSTITNRKYVIFQMTHDKSNYKNYPVLEGITAKNEKELKEKIDEFLDNLIKIINKPIQFCPHCEGIGFLKDAEKK